ncbi:MAG TPA: hypothetical protein VL354_17805 [Spirochaetia bacterium]|nr:hypothetical protein [Spirochaetia bacterium]
MKRVAWIIFAVLLVGQGLWAQAAGSPASGTGSAQGAAPAQGSSAPGSAQGSAAPSAGSDESDFFGSGDVEAKQGAAEKQNVAEAVESEKLGFSGQLQSLSSYSMTRNFVQGNTGFSDNTFTNTVMGDFLVDARLPKSYRMFLDLNINYVPTGVAVPVTFTGVFPPNPFPQQLVLAQTQTTVLDIKEVFVDFNFAQNAIHFRAGKQVLQWGTGYFWNPTDLINVAHKSFTNLNALLDGVFGLRTDVTFSNAFHLYTFINLNGVNDVTNIAYAARAEFLAGTVEFGFSGWYEYNKVPVFGADITTPLFWELNMTGEASLSYGDNIQKLDTNNVAYSVSNQLVPKVDVGLSRTFDVLNVQDRLTVMTEFFWNSDGYSQNMFQSLGAASLANFLNGYYHASYYGQYYGALFGSINDFGLPNMTLSVNGLMNFSDTTAIALVGLSDSPVNNFTLQVQLGTFLGPNFGEYTVTANSTTGALGSNMFFVILSAQVNF